MNMGGFILNLKDLGTPTCFTVDHFHCIAHPCVIITPEVHPFDAILNYRFIQSGDIYYFRSTDNHSLVKRELIHGDEDNSSPQDALSTRIKEEDEVDTKRIKNIENGVKPSRECPYLDTIDRHVLDFDFEKLCSVSLSRINVYACLVKRSEYSRLHNYEIIDSSLADIIYVLNPIFSPELIKRLETSSKEVRAYCGSMYIPGIVGCKLSLQKDFSVYGTRRLNIVYFLALNALHMALGGTKKPNSSIIYKTFLGGMRIHTRKIKADESGKPEDMSTYSDDDEDDSEYQWKTVESPFLYLTTELPPMPLFRDENYENIIPQVSLYNILTKFNGEREMEYKTYKDNFLKKFEITRLPPFVILYIKRFTKNTFYVEKNHTIVNFPIKSIEFGDILAPELKEKMSEGDGTYDLLANIVHDGDPKDGTYKVHILHKGSGKWFEMQDLHVDKILPEILPLSEAYIQIYERRSSSK
ncbi:USP39 [Lepeophtheirus salmonis]|uniref:ubiquitinyl hydrolase 1 n=1 Tax=Lepeophtheirus salmonis TaxID=72036 RepID=A0A7R8GZF9_LEPSM|nr:USP39 [Lepeophtheirus salmonis]CAF2765322.1 USP39 [Lepeophtheirus salmonis]